MSGSSRTHKFPEKFQKAQGEQKLPPASFITVSLPKRVPPLLDLDLASTSCLEDDGIVTQRLNTLLIHCGNEPVRRVRTLVPHESSLRKGEKSSVEGRTVDAERLAAHRG
jgi:hypothetical protein